MSSTHRKIVSDAGKPINPLQQRYMQNQKRSRRTGLLAMLVATGISLCMLIPSAHAAGDILNASYDVTRELFKEIHPAFVADWKIKADAELIQTSRKHTG